MEAARPSTTLADCDTQGFVLRRQRRKTQSGTRSKSSEANLPALELTLQLEQPFISALEEATGAQAHIGGTTALMEAAR